MITSLPHVMMGMMMMMVVMVVPVCGTCACNGSKADDCNEHCGDYLFHSFWFYCLSKY